MRLPKICAFLLAGALACNAQVINTVAGGGSTSLGTIFGIAAASNGDIYIAATTRHQIFKLTLAPPALTVVTGTGKAAFTGDGGDPLKASLNNPTGVALDSNGDLYIVDQNNNRIRKITFSSNRIDTVVGNGAHGYGGDGGDPLNAALANPVGIAFDARGNLYIADQGNNRIRVARFGSNPFISTAAGTGVAGFSEQNDPEHDQLSGPTGVVCDNKNNVFFADQGNNRVRKITFGSNSAITTVAGTGTAAFGGDGANPASANLSGPIGVGLDTSGNLYIADTGNNRIRKVTLGTSPVIATVAGNGTKGFSGDGGAPTDAELASPTGVAIGPDGKLYIADYLNGRVRQADLPTGGGGGESQPVITQVASTFPTNSGLAPRSLAAIYGNYLADTTHLGPLTNPQVFVNGVPATIGDTQRDSAFSGNSSIIFQVPSQISAGSASVVVVNDGQSSNPFSTTILPYAPALDCTGPNSTQNFCGFHDDDSAVSLSNRAIPGETLQVYVDGLGGAETPPTPALTINGQPVTVNLVPTTFQDGLTGHVIFFDVPALDPGLYPIIFSVAGHSSPAAQLPVGSATSGGTVTISSLSPPSAPVGSADFVLTVHGSGFASFDVVAWNGMLLPTTLVDSSTLTATISSSLLTMTGTANVQVGDSDGALISNIVGFSILAPVITSLTPDSTSAGHADFPLAVTGSSFIPGSVVYFDGAALPTTFVDSTHLTANVTSGLVAGMKTVQVQVLNLSTFSNQVPFTIGSGGTTPIPAITDVFNSFAQSAGLSPGVLAEAAGTNLADGNQIGPRTNPIVLVGGAAALIESTTVSAGSSYILFQIPSETPTGTVPVVVQNNGISSDPFNITVKQYSPTIDTYVDTYYGFHADGTQVTKASPAIPGEVIHIRVDGLGAVDPPPAPTLTIDGSPVIITLKKITFQGGTSAYQATFTVPALSSGTHPMILLVSGNNSPTVLFPVGAPPAGGLLVSQTGATFRAVARSITTLERDVLVSTTGGVISWTATPKTFSGGDWLQIDPHSGTSDPFQSPPVIRITASAAKLDAGDYFGNVTITAADSSSTQVISVVLSVSAAQASPGPVVEPTGMIFVSAPDNVPAAQNTQITNPSTSPLTFTSLASFSNSGSIWFGYQPSTGSVSPGPPQQVSVQPLAGLQTGIYTGSITFHFSDGSSRVVSLLWVVAPGAPSSSSSFARAFRQPGDPQATNPACTPKQLLAVLTTLPVNFATSVAFPTPIEALVVDDCGNPLIKGAGSVVLQFSNHNPDLMMQAQSPPPGSWARTWVPQPPFSSDLAVTLIADSATLHGTATVRGSAANNPNVPLIHVGGIVAASSYVHTVAPGTIISIFGDQMISDTTPADTLPLPTQLSGTSVTMGDVKLPLFYGNQTQINAMIPYGLKKGSYYLSVRRGTERSNDEPVILLDTQPGVFTRDSSGKGDGAIYATRSKVYFKPTPSAPAKSGDVLTVFCSGLGEVQTPVKAGDPAPSIENRTIIPVTATVGGVAATVSFAGLTPGFAGLYQVNLTVPKGVTGGDHVPVILTSANRSSEPVTVAIR